MSSPYAPQQPPRKLTRSTSNKFIGGVCGGIAEYLNMDPNLVRILTVVISLFTGVPIILYLVALFLLPEDRTVTPPPPVNGPPAPYGQGSYGQGGYGQAGYGQTGAGDHVWGPEGAPWEQTSAPAPSPGPSPSRAPSAPATAQPENPTPQASAPEPLAETSAAEPSIEETSSWESAGADPTGDAPHDSGETPTSDGGPDKRL